MKRLDRRTLLRAAGGAVLSVPLLEALGCYSPAPSALGSQAAALAGPPKRLVCFWTPLGTYPSRWFPTGSETQFTLGPLMAPLEPHKADLLALKGIDMPSSAALGATGDGHGRGLNAVLTGVHTVGTSGLAGGVSVDQCIAHQIGNTTRLRSLELGVQTRYNGDATYEHLSYLSASSPLPVEENPTNAFNRVFAGLVAPGGSVDPIFARRKSVLDHVNADYARLISDPRLSLDDRRKVQAHLASIRDVELRLTTAPPTSSTCAKPTLQAFDPHLPSNVPRAGKAQMDILAMALACDLTRVGSLMWSYGRSMVVHSWLDPTITEEHHALSHLANPDAGGSPDAAGNRKYEKINLFYAEQFAYLLAKLKSIPEGTGSLLDNTVVFWCNELGEPRGHTHTNMPFVLAGGRGGANALRTGRFLTYPGASHNDLLVSICQAMGVGVSTFGDPAFCRGPLPGLI